MRKAVIVALGIVGAGIFVQPVFAGSACKEWRNACYQRAASQKAARKCHADYDRCIGADVSVLPVNQIVPPVPGLGMPMQSRNPIVPVEANPATPSFSSPQIAAARVVKAHSNAGIATGSASSSSSPGGTGQSNKTNGKGAPSTSNHN